MTTNPTPTPDAAVITEILFNQLLNVMGMKHPNWFSRILFFILSKPVARMSGLLVELDRNIVQKGLSLAANQLMGNFVTQVQLHGAESIPKGGPFTGNMQPSSGR